MCLTILVPIMNSCHSFSASHIHIYSVILVYNFVYLQCPTLTCKQPPIDTYIVTITGVTTRLEMVDASFCNAQFLLEECGVYAFTVKATNREGTSPASSAIPICMFSNDHSFVSFI